MALAGNRMLRPKPHEEAAGSVSGAGIGEGAAERRERVCKGCFRGSAAYRSRHDGLAGREELPGGEVRPSPSD